MLLIFDQWQPPVLSALVLGINWSIALFATVIAAADPYMFGSHFPKERNLARAVPVKGGFVEMKSVLKTAAVVAAIAGAALGVSGPARAGVSIGINIGVPIPVPGAVAYDYDSGGYCDRWGCPDEYWDMPVYYGPVFYDGSWFQGPTYYRDYGGARWFWVHGGWRRDEWRHPRDIRRSPE